MIHVITELGFAAAGFGAAALIIWEIYRHADEIREVMGWEVER